MDVTGSILLYYIYDYLQYYQYYHQRVNLYWTYYYLYSYFTVLHNFNFYSVAPFIGSTYINIRHTGTSWIVINFTEDHPWSSWQPMSKTHICWLYLSPNLTQITKWKSVKHLINYRNQTDHHSQRDRGIRQFYSRLQVSRLLNYLLVGSTNKTNLLMQCRYAHFPNKSLFR